MGGLGSARKMPAQQSKQSMESFRAALPVPPVTLEDAYMTTMADALEHCGWNMTQAAQRLGADRRTLYRMVERWGIDPTRERARAEMSRG